MSTVPFPPAPNDRPSGFSRRTLLTASAAAGLSGLCAGYVAITRPLLRPAEGVDRQPFAFTSQPLNSARINKSALLYLPDQPWAAKAEWEVHNGRSILFFNSCEPLEPKSGEPNPQGSEVRLEPFAMVLPPKAGREGEAPVTVVASAAILRVAGSLEFENADPGRIIGGRMPGAVRLRGPEGLNLQGTDFRFDEAAQRIWSDKPVAFVHGAHHGRGHGVQLELFRVAPPEAYDAVAVNGVSVVRLLRDVDMELQLDDARGGPFGSLEGSRETTADSSEKPLPTRVTCSGSFTFDIDRNEASFTKDVVASRVVPGQQPDQLECDVLSIGFEPSTDAARHAAVERRGKIKAGTLTEDDGFQTVDEDLTVTWLKATQSPDAARPARLRSPANEFVADFTQLAYDAATGVTTLTREGGAVEARQNASTLVSPIVTIEPATGDAPPTVVCVGKGWLQHFDEQGHPALTAHWTESLRRLRAADGLDLIRLIGEARVEQPQDKFALGGDRIDLWLDPNEGNVSKQEPRAESLVASRDMKPIRLLAESLSRDPDPRKNLRVKLRSPELLADATRLEVEFVDPAPATSTARRRSRSTLATASKRLLLAAAETDGRLPQAPPPEPPEFLPPKAAAANPALPSITPGDAAADKVETTAPAAAPSAGPATAPAQTAVAPPEPIELAAAVIKVIAERPQQNATTAARTSPSDREGQVREVHTTGGVIVRQKRSDGEPLLIEGDRLDLFNRGVEQELVHIYGTAEETGVDGGVLRKAAPARVHDQGATLFGLNINLDRATNRAWVEGQGVLEMPAKGAAGAMELDDEAASEEPEPPLGEPAEPEMLTVWWHDSMEFDGDRAKFFGDVQTELQANLMTCQEMEVRLTSRFDFATAGKPGAVSDRETRPEIAEVICRQRVRVDGKAREGDKLVEVRRAEFDEFRLDQRTGDTHAIGPGWIEIWQRGDGNRAGLAADNAVRANSSISRDEAAWEYMFVEFSRTSDGNYKRQTTKFRNDVRVVYGPVSDHTRKIDPHRPDKAPAEAGWMTCKELTLTRHKKTESTPTYSDVLGEGNVRLAGRGFSAVADWVSYDESKGQYVIKSFGKHSATVAKNNADGQGAGDWDGQQITFYPALGKFHVDKATGGGGVQ
ncbi:MAG: hypothetical protein WBC44_02470 [Planctomycetaceae bacterium]